MNKWFTAVLVGTALSFQVYAAQVVVVAEFQDRTNTNIGLGARAQEQITGVLVKLPHLQIVERTRMDQIIEEMNFSQSAYVDTSTAAEFGKKSGAELVVFGSVSNASYSVGEQSQLLGENKVAVGVGRATVNVIMVNVETNQTIFSESVSAEAIGDKNAATVLPMSIDNAVNELWIAFQEKFSIRGYVIATEEEGRKYLVYLDVGTDVGVGKGRKVTVFSEDKVFIHPVTKKERRISQPLMELKISLAEGDYAIAKVKKKDFQKIVAGMKIEVHPEKRVSKGKSTLFDFKSLNNLLKKD
ncbi:MAG: CsgG/HfaB family protein [bacterium]|nr:hypothetical protein [Gammaproteobacteria bacterium]